MFASLCVVRGCYIFGDTSLVEEAELHVLIMQASRQQRTLPRTA